MFLSPGSYATRWLGTPIAGSLFFVDRSTMDSVTRQRRSEIMSRVRAKGTRPEMAVRRLVHSLGYRYRLHSSQLPGRPDLVFAGRRKVIFVHGCFWHRHPHCHLARIPKSRIDFWRAKLDGNRQRDLLQQRELEELGWRLLVLWECQVGDLNSVTERVTAFLEDRP